MAKTKPGRRREKQQIQRDIQLMQSEAIREAEREEYEALLAWLRYEEWLNEKAEIQKELAKPRSDFYFEEDDFCDDYFNDDPYWDD